MNPGEEFLKLITASAETMGLIAITIGRGFRGMAASIGQVTGEIIKPIVEFMKYYEIAVVEEKHRKSIKERRRARYLRMTTGKHNQRARKSKGRK